MSLYTTVQKVKDFHSLLELFTDELEWDIDPASDLDEITFEWEADELNLSESSAQRLKDGAIRQLRPFPGVKDQPWGIFFIEFADHHVYRTALRQVLRKLVRKQRDPAANRPTWQHENLLFICATKDYQRFTLAHFRGQKANRAVLAMFGWDKGDTHIRTLCEYNLPALRFPQDPADSEGWLKQWRAAFDVEAVTDKFFDDYRDVFDKVEAEVKKSIRKDEDRRLFTQRLFNRLMFLYFIQKKGWLKFEGDASYLRALFNKAEATHENFMSDRLYWVFFYGLSNAGESIQAHTHETLIEKRGEVPYLNGGLFDLEDDYDIKDAVKLPNKSFARILELFERYNFTVMESTPLDVQVAVDPEMLGKVFEELVTGRHESGSYYTPRPIVSFMCREALKHYLVQATGASMDSVSRFVDDEDASEVKDAERTLEALKQVRVCDPACGSGAYLLGMLQELLRLRAALFKSRHIDNESVYNRKRSIIENNLYGVDKDKFAVQIACLRLWLSLAIDSNKPQPLPNLDFKIGCGDSLAAPSPSNKDQQLDMNRSFLVGEFRRLKGEFMRCENSERKKKLREKIEEIRSEIALALKHSLKRPSQAKIDFVSNQVATLGKQIRQAVAEKNHAKAATLQKQLETNKRTLASWESVKEDAEPIFDWAVEFAEVFSPEVRDTGRFDDTFTFMNEVESQQVLITRIVDGANGGFDIVVANPPYVRQELLGREYKERRLKPVYLEVYSGTADLYVYFYARAMQLLKKDGVGSFISSNKWLRAGYGEKLRQELLDKQAFHLIVDFGDLPVFKATAYPSIFLWQKRARENAETVWATVNDLQRCYTEGIHDHVAKIAHHLPPFQFGIGKPRIATSTSAARHITMQAVGHRLGEILQGRLLNGVKTGLNDAFIIERATRDQMIKSDEKSRRLIKPLLVGDDIRRFEAHFRDKFLLYIPWDTNISSYPAVLAWLKEYQPKLKERDSVKNNGSCPWFALSRPRPEAQQFYDSIKIVYPVISKEPRFVMDTEGHYSNDKVFMLPTDDWYLLGILNSTSVCTWAMENLSRLRGGFYEFRGLALENLPIPDAPTPERNAIAKLAEQAQALHTKRRKRVERFLHDISISTAESSSRNPLEQPWNLSADDFKRRARNAAIQLFNDTRDETIALTEGISKIEREIDERVAALYDVPLVESQSAEITIEAPPSPFA